MNFFPMLANLISTPDDGPIYRETMDFSRFIVEPWNAFSSLTFLIPAFFFLWTLRGKYKTHGFLIYFCIPLLILGGLGSTFFHAFRSSGWLLAMDVFPIVILVLGLSCWMWLKVLPKSWLLVPIIALFLGLTFLARHFLVGQDQISSGYVFRGSMLLVPCFWFLSKTHFFAAKSLVAATLSFVSALTFRFLDEKIFLSFMPCGTHWLWHVSTAFGAYFLGKYIITNAERNRLGSA